MRIIFSNRKLLIVIGVGDDNSVNGGFFWPNGELDRLRATFYWS